MIRKVLSVGRHCYCNVLWKEELRAGMYLLMGNCMWPFLLYFWLENLTKRDIYVYVHACVRAWVLPCALLYVYMWKIAIYLLINGIGWKIHKYVKMHESKFISDSNVTLDSATFVSVTMKFLFLSCGTRPCACLNDVKITTKYVTRTGFILSPRSTCFG